MLYRASTKDVKDGRLSRRYGYLVVVMQYYPRFLKKEMVDEYVNALAPDRALFTEFKARSREIEDHDRAFQEVSYEDRFQVSAEGMGQLERLSQMAAERDVFLICQCQSLEHCHGDLLLLLASHTFGAKIQRPRVSYPAYERRLSLSRSP